MCSFVIELRAMSHASRDLSHASRDLSRAKIKFIFGTPNINETYAGLITRKR